MKEGGRSHRKDPQTMRAVERAQVTTAQDIQKKEGPNSCREEPQPTPPPCPETRKEPEKPARPRSKGGHLDTKQTTAR